jgi:acetyl-CoA carboxylase biotin carboxyl carrier protein
MKLDIENIKALAEALEKNQLSEISIESAGVKITLKKEGCQMSTMPMGIPMTQMYTPTTLSVEKEASIDKEVEDDKYQVVVSPMVGTFYAAPAPGADAFVSIGQQIEEGDTLCIVEAMKMMNEVQSPVKGRLVKVLAKNGEIVKKGDKLFLVE